MLFEIQYFWKNLGIVVFFWVLYAIFGFEFVAITLLSLILSIYNK